MNCDLTLRAPEPGDVDALYRWENDPREWRATAHGPVSRQRLWQYVSDYDGDIYSAGELRLIIADADGNAVGTLDLTDFNPRHLTAEVGVYVSEPWRGRGTASEALRQLHAYARDVVGMRGLLASVTHGNTVSRRLFASLGYKQSGRLPGWLGPGEDLLLYTLSL